MLRYRSVLHVEVVQRNHSSLNKDQLKPAIKEFVRQNLRLEELPKTWTISEELDELYSHVERIHIPLDSPFLQDSQLRIHIYKLNPYVVGYETTMELSEDVSAAHCRILPTEEFDGLWETLIYGDKLKENALRYMETALITSQCEVDTKLISLNRMMLLSGPPGTGKTSLCKALAQKTSIRMMDKFSQFQLIEVNSHSLFSKWFSESGKLVQKLFDQLHEILEDPKIFLFVLIDEVESLTRSRSDSKNEPSDGMRVVNALLTQIDQLKTYNNVLVLTTSNLRHSIDDAFLDRADVSYEVGLPTQETSYDILYSCIMELSSKGLIGSSKGLFNHRLMMDSKGPNEASQVLWDIVNAMGDQSARSLRKIPFQALMNVPELPTDMMSFLQSLKSCCVLKT